MHPLVVIKPRKYAHNPEASVVQIKDIFIAIRVPPALVFMPSKPLGNPTAKSAKNIAAVLLDLCVLV